MTVINVTYPHTIFGGPGVLTKISIPYNQDERRFPQVNSPILLSVADTAIYTDHTPPFWSLDYTTCMLTGQRVPYYWEQARTNLKDPMIVECVLSTYSIPFKRGLSVTSLPEGAILSLTFDFYAPSPSPTKPTSAHEIMQSLEARYARIAAKQPVPPLRGMARLQAIQYRMWINENRKAALHTTHHFIPRSLPPSVKIEGPLPCVVDEKIIPSHIHAVDYLRMSAIENTWKAPSYPKVVHFDWSTVISNDNIEPMSEAEIELPSVQILPQRIPLIAAQSITHATITRRIGYVR